MSCHSFILPLPGEPGAVCGAVSDLVPEPDRHHITLPAYAKLLTRPGGGQVPVSFETADFMCDMWNRLELRLRFLRPLGLVSEYCAFLN